MSWGTYKFVDIDESPGVQDEPQPQPKKVRLDDPEPEKSQVLDLRAKLQAARQAKKDCDDDHQSQGNTADRRITRALTRSLRIEEDEDSEEWEESRHCSVSRYCSDTG